MKAKKAKEQFIGLVILSSVFVFFLYLKMNPEINISSNNGNNINKIIEQKVQEVQTEMTDSKTEEIIEEDISNKSVIALVEKQSITLFTEKELKRAKAYLDKDWRPDNTINMAAWDYVSKNPNINNVKNKKEDTKLYYESNQVANTLK